MSSVELMKVLVTCYGRVRMGEYLEVLLLFLLVCKSVSNSYYIIHTYIMTQQELRDWGLFGCTSLLFSRERQAIQEFHNLFLSTEMEVHLYYLWNVRTSYLFGL